MFRIASQFILCPLSARSLHTIRVQYVAAGRNVCEFVCMWCWDQSSVTSAHKPCVSPYLQQDGTSQVFLTCAHLGKLPSHLNCDPVTHTGPSSKSSKESDITSSVGAYIYMPSTSLLKKQTFHKVKSEISETSSTRCLGFQESNSVARTVRRDVHQRLLT